METKASPEMNKEALEDAAMMYRADAPIPSWVDHLLKREAIGDALATAFEAGARWQSAQHGPPCGAARTLNEIACHAMNSYGYKSSDRIVQNIIEWSKPWYDWEDTVAASCTQTDNKE